MCVCVCITHRIYIILYCTYMLCAHNIILLPLYCFARHLSRRRRFISLTRPFYTRTHNILLLLYDRAHRSFTRVICCTWPVIVFTLSRIIIINIIIITIIYLRAPMNYKHTSVYARVFKFYNVY
jgi:hypothetical protein